MKKLKPITLKPRDRDKKGKLPPDPLEIQQNKQDRRMFLLESRIQSLEHKFETVIGYPKNASGGGGCGGSLTFDEALLRYEDSNRQRALNYDVKFNSF